MIEFQQSNPLGHVITLILTINDNRDAILYYICQNLDIFYKLFSFIFQFNNEILGHLLNSL